MRGGCRAAPSQLMRQSLGGRIGSGGAPLRPSSPEKREQLRRLHSESVALLDWYVRHQGFSYAAPFREALDSALAKGRLTEMRQLARELRGFVTELPPDIRALLLASVEAESGVSLAGSDSEDARLAESILDRGAIASDAEYFLLRAHLERVSNDPSKADGATRVIAVLDSYRPAPDSAT